MNISEDRVNGRSMREEEWRQISRNNNSCARRPEDLLESRVYIPNDGPR